MLTTLVTLLSAPMAVADAPPKNSGNQPIIGFEYLSNTHYPTGYRDSRGWLVAGLSGIDYDPRRGQFVVVRDNPMQDAVPGGSDDPNVQYLRPVMVSGERGYRLEFDGGRLLTPEGDGKVIDSPESVRYDPNGDGLWFTNENSGSLFDWHVDNSRLEVIVPSNARGNPSGNRGPEGMTFAVSGNRWNPNRLWIGAEGHIATDPDNISRLTEVTRDGKAVRQVAYTLDGVPGGGISEILAVNENTLLVMQRVWYGRAPSATGGESQNLIRIYRVDVGQATDIKDRAGLTSEAIGETGGVTPAQRTLVFDSADYNLAKHPEGTPLDTPNTKIDNIEGMAFGPRLADGRATLVLVSDNNNNPKQLKTQFIVLAIDGDAPVPYSEVEWMDPQQLQRWQGGAGSWSAKASNWQSVQQRGQVPWEAGKRSILAGEEGGVITLDTRDGPIAPQGLYFMTDGYRLQGDALTLPAEATEFHVGDGARIDAGQTTATIDARLTGSGGLEKTGLGTLVLNADNDYRGLTQVEAGRLAVNGRINGEVKVARGATLGGNGRVGSTTVAGRLAPGNSIGTLTVAGDLTFEQGSTYDVEVDNRGNSDRTEVSGLVRIDDDVTVEVSPEDRREDGSTYRAETRYTILSAGQGIDGTFARVDDRFALLSARLDQTENDIGLILTRDDGQGGVRHFADVVDTPNRKATAGAVEALGAGNSLFEAALYLPDRGVAPAVDQLSGELYPAVTNVLTDQASRERGILTRRLDSAHGESRLSAAAPQQIAGDAHSAAWFQAMGGHADYAGDDNGKGATVDRRKGLLAGIDGEIGAGWRLGFAAGGGGEKIGLKGEDDSADVDSYHVGVYAGKRMGALSLNLGAVRSWHRIESERRVGFPRFADHLEGKFDATTTQAFAEAALHLDAGGIRWQPYAGLSRVRVDSDAFDEHGGAAALHVSRADHAISYVSTGLRAATDFSLGGTSGYASVGAGWRHALEQPKTTQRVAFRGSEDTFEVSSADIGDNRLTLELSGGLALTERTHLGLTYGGAFGDGSRDQTLGAELKVAF